MESARLLRATKTFRDLFGSRYFDLALILITALLIRLFGITKELWYDELAALSFAIDPDFLARALQYNQPPLYYGLLAVWAKFNDSDLFLRCLSLVFGMLTVFTTYHWLKFYSIAAARVGSLLVASFPILIRYSLEVRPYGLLLLSFSAALYFAEKLLRSSNPNHRSILLLSIALAVAILTHPIAVFILPAMAIYILSHPARSWPIGRGLIVSFAVPGFLFLLIFLFILQPHSVGPWWVPSVDWPILKKSMLSVFGIWNSRYPYLTFGLLGIISALVVWQLRDAQRRRVAMPLILSFFSYLVPLYLYSTFFKAILLPRTAMPILFPFIGLLAIGITSIARGRPYIVLSVLILSMLFQFSWIKRERYAYTQNWRQSFQLIKSRWQPGDLLLYQDRTVLYQKIEKRFLGAEFDGGTMAVVDSDAPFVIRLQNFLKLRREGGLGGECRVFFIAAYQMSEETLPTLLKNLGLPQELGQRPHLWTWNCPVVSIEEGVRRE